MLLDIKKYLLPAPQVSGSGWQEVFFYAELYLWAKKFLPSKLLIYLAADI